MHLKNNTIKRKQDAFMTFYVFLVKINVPSVYK